VSEIAVKQILLSKMKESRHYIGYYRMLYKLLKQKNIKLSYLPIPSLMNFQLKTSEVLGIGAEKDLLGAGTESMMWYAFFVSSLKGPSIISRRSLSNFTRLSASVVAPTDQM